jgi:hypothetical protein
MLYSRRPVSSKAPGAGGELEEGQQRWEGVSQLVGSLAANRHRAQLPKAKLAAGHREIERLSDVRFTKPELARRLWEVERVPSRPDAFHYDHSACHHDHTTCDHAHAARDHINARHHNHDGFPAIFR